MFPGSGLTFTLVDSDFIFHLMTITGAIGIADTVDAITGDPLVRSLLVMSCCGGSDLVEEQDYVSLIVLTTRLKFPTANASQRLGSGEEGATVEKNLQEIDQTESIVLKKSIARQTRPAPPSWTWKRLSDQLPFVVSSFQQPKDVLIHST